MVGILECRLSKKIEEISFSSYDFFSTCGFTKRLKETIRSLCPAQEIDPSPSYPEKMVI